MRVVTNLEVDAVSQGYNDLAGATPTQLEL
jgi:hypothetical protein